MYLCVCLFGSLVCDCFIAWALSIYRNVLLHVALAASNEIYGSVKEFRMKYVQIMRKYVNWNRLFLLALLLAEYVLYVRCAYDSFLFTLKNKNKYVFYVIE